MDIQCHSVDSVNQNLVLFGFLRASGLKSLIESELMDSGTIRMLKIECVFGYHTFPQKHCYNTAKKDYCKLEGKAVE